MSNSALDNLTIRAAELADTEALAGLITQLGYETRGSEMKMRLETIERDARYRTFVAVNAGKICGMIGTVCFYGYEHNNPGGRIIALVVREDVRGRDVGRRLIVAAENDFAQRGITRVAVNTRFTRKKAHAFYEKAGYTANGFRFVKDLPGGAD
jgi:GNAT superfamily N-acetyltransferase